MTDAPNVSVVVPAYNCCSVLPEAIESVRRQSYQDFEVLLVDDGSTDGTWEVIRKIAADWPKVRAIRAEHKGLAAARNRAIAEMKGKWIALLDADDIWQPEKLQRCMDFLAGHQHLRIVYTPMDPIRLDGQPMKGHSKPCKAGWLTEELFYSIFVHDPAVVFHKDVVEACGGFDESLPVCVGHEFWLRVSTKFEFGLIDQPLALRRWHESSVTRSDRARARRARAKVLERFYNQYGGRELLKEKQKARRRLARVQYGAGKILFQQRRFHEAAEYLRKARQIDPSFWKTYPFAIATAVGRFLGLAIDETG